MRFPLKQTVLVARYISRKKGEKCERFPLVLMLEPLHACNLTCSGCGRIREYREYLAERLPLDACLKAIDDCCAPVVSICGGEPLIYQDIGELVEGALGREKVVYLCTNGQLLEKGLPKFKPHKFFNINVHLDGLAKTHDTIVEKKGAFDRAVAGMTAAKKAGFTVCTNTTVYSQTDTDEVRALIDFLEGLGVDGILISPGFDYTDVADQGVFLKRVGIVEKFSKLRDVCRSKKVWSTPLFLDFLAGRREFPCTPWGNVTYNVKGWKAPCYLITDAHYDTFDRFMSAVKWASYGPGKDKRCENCMAHCGFEPTAALTASSSLKDAMRIAWWTFF